MAINIEDADLYKDMMLKLQYYKEEVIKNITSSFLSKNIVI